MLKDLVKATRTYMGKSEKTSGNKYKVVFKYNGQTATMIYHDNYLNNSGKNEFLYALLMDGLAFANCFNLADFTDEFGYDYDNLPQAKKAFDSCAKQLVKLQRLFTEEEIEQLQEEFSDF